MRVWKNDTRSVPNTELKKMVEAYKTKGRENQDQHEPKEDRESAVGRLGAAKKGGRFQSSVKTDQNKTGTDGEVNCRHRTEEEKKA